MKTIIYIRVSHKDQVEHGFSLENQRERLTKYAEYKGFEIVKVIEDRGISGRTTQKRDGFQEMMGMIKSVDCVIVYSISRFARSVMDTLNTIQILKQNNVEFHSVNENVDTSSAQGRFFLTVMSALAEMESDQMGERIRSVMSYKKDTGLVYCGNTPFGYDKVDGKLVPNESEQALIQRMRALRKKKYSYDKIAQLFNMEGIISKTGSRFHATTIRKIILNDLHSGIIPSTDIPEPDGVLPMCVGVQSIDGISFSNAVPYC